MKIGLYTLTSPLHDPVTVDSVSNSFIKGIEEALADADLLDGIPDGRLEFDFRGGDYSDYGSRALDLIFVRTGGSEGLFKELFDKGTVGTRPVFLLASGQSNSLAASMEILSFLVGAGRQGEIIHGSYASVAKRIAIAARISSASKILSSQKLGVVGKPSDWLISSGVDYSIVRQRFGIEIVDIPMEELLDEIALKQYPVNPAVEAALAFAAGDGRASVAGSAACCGTGIRHPESCRNAVEASMEGALHIYGALHRIVRKHGLGGLTIRCFDLLTAVGNTGCLALAILNSEGISSGCEGDIPTLISMAVARALTGKSGFQANPSRIDPETGEVLFAHCTVPLDIVRSYSYDTHFESGIGVALHGELPEGGVTVFKLAADMSRCCIEEASLLTNSYQENLCRTQVLLKMDCATDVFLKNPAGNHHLIVPGRHKAIIEAYMNTLHNPSGKL